MEMEKEIDIKKFCRSCGSDNYEIVKTPDLVHEAKRMCLDCGKFINWVPKSTGNYKTEIEDTFNN